MMIKSCTNFLNLWLVMDGFFHPQNVATGFGIVVPSYTRRSTSHRKHRKAGLLSFHYHHGRHDSSSSSGRSSASGQRTTTATATAAVGSAHDSRRDIGIGIDLGTTFSAVAYLNDANIPTMIPIPHNGRTMPSLVALQPNNSSSLIDFVVGHAARECVTEPYSHVKRVLGTGGKLSTDTKQVVPFVRPSPVGKTYHKDSLANQIADAENHPTMLVSSLGGLRDDDNDDPKNNNNNNNNNHTNSSSLSSLLRPEDVSAAILRHLVETAEDVTGCHVTRAVIGVPAYFHDAQRAATHRAAQQAGLQRVKLLREPEAAALAYGLGKELQVRSLQQQQHHHNNYNNYNNYNNDDDDEELVLVFDLGGGTFDVSMLLVGGGLTEIISTSGNAQLGGANFDARIAEHFQAVLDKAGRHSTTTTTSLIKLTRQWSETAHTHLVGAAERTRIFLSNNRRAYLVLPLSETAWENMTHPDRVLLSEPLWQEQQQQQQQADGTPHANQYHTNGTHVFLSLSRPAMEALCKEEFQALLRPVREVAIMSGALLPGDSSPTLVEAALELEDEYLAASSSDLVFDDFYQTTTTEPTRDNNNKNVMEEEQLLLLQQAELKATKKAQQRGRKRARNVAKRERQYRQEKRKLTQPTGKFNKNNNNQRNVKVRDGISGRPIRRVVLVGGATRMPACGRLIAALTGVTPQKTVHPDEAVALGCAVHVGVLDGDESMGTVLNPMQAAILRAVALQQQQQQQGNNNVNDDFDDDEFGQVEYF